MPVVRLSRIGAFRTKFQRNRWEVSATGGKSAGAVARRLPDDWRLPGQAPEPGAHALADRAVAERAYAAFPGGIDGVGNVIRPRSPTMTRAQSRRNNPLQSGRTCHTDPSYPTPRTGNGPYAHQEADCPSAARIAIHNTETCFPTLEGRTEQSRRAPASASNCAKDIANASCSMLLVAGSLSTGIGLFMDVVYERVVCRCSISGELVQNPMQCRIRWSTFPLVFLASNSNAGGGRSKPRASVGDQGLTHTRENEMFSVAVPKPLPVVGAVASLARSAVLAGPESSWGAR